MAIVQHRESMPAFEQCFGMGGIARMIWEELGIKKRAVF